MSRLTRLERFMLEMMYEMNYTEFRLSEGADNTIFLGEPIGCFECVNALAALIQYGVTDADTWSHKRDIYLKMCKDRGIEED